MKPKTDGVMVALLPVTTDWSLLDVPHMTLVYAGTTSALDISTYNELGKDALSIALSFSPQTLDVMGIETLGDADEKVDALLLKPTPEILAMRSVLEPWNASEWPFKPHATIGPVGTPVRMPTKLTFDRVYYAWGGKGSVMPLRST
jgi:hypothetical protein